MSDTEPFQTVGVRFPRPVRSLIEATAAGLGMTVSEWVRMAAYRQLDAPPTPDQVTEYRGKVAKGPVTNGKVKTPAPARSLARREVEPFPKTGKR